jgi:hypothetical protein
VSYPSICTDCYKPVDIDWFAAEKEAGRLPIVHDCGRVLYRGTFAHIGEAGLDAEARGAAVPFILPLPMGARGAYLASPASPTTPQLHVPTTPPTTPHASSKAPFRQTRPCEHCGKSVVVERSTKKFCGPSCRKKASRKRLKSDLPAPSEDLSR